MSCSGVEIDLGVTDAIPKCNNKKAIITMG